MIKIIGPKDRTKYKGQYIDTCSGSEANWSRELSPFLAGPVYIPHLGYDAYNVENAWQFSKVYKQHTDEWGEPSNEWFKWAMEGFRTKRGIRYPMGKGAKPEYAYWDGKKYGYVEARKKIYVPNYANAICNTEAYKLVKETYKNTGEVILYDVDGYDYLALGHTLEQCLNDPTRIMGHAFVIGLMLEGII